MYMQYSFLCTLQWNYFNNYWFDMCILITIYFLIGNIAFINLVLKFIILLHYIYTEDSCFIADIL